jgi:cytochrome bd ubiquinol oxidase subunit I
MGVWLLIKNKLYTQSWYLRLCVLISPLGFLAVIAGWLTAETGRQPWIVYGLLKTADAVSIVPMVQVLISLLLFIVGYWVIFAFYLYFLFTTLRKGPSEEISPITLGYMPHPKDLEPDHE